MELDPRGFHSREAMFVSRADPARQNDDTRHTAFASRRVGLNSRPNHWTESSTQPVQSSQSWRPGVHWKNATGTYCGEARSRKIVWNPAGKRRPVGFAGGGMTFPALNEYAFICRSMMLTAATLKRSGVILRKILDCTCGPMASAEREPITVSYTHLTLPTKRIV